MVQPLAAAPTSADARRGAATAPKTGVAAVGMSAPPPLPPKAWPAAQLLGGALAPPLSGRPPENCPVADCAPPPSPPLLLFSWPTDESAGAHRPPMLRRLLASFCTCTGKGARDSGHRYETVADDVLRSSCIIAGMFHNSALEIPSSIQPDHALGQTSTRHTCSERVRPASDALWLWMPRMVGCSAAAAPRAPEQPPRNDAASASLARACDVAISRTELMHGACYRRT